MADDEHDAAETPGEGEQKTDAADANNDDNVKNDPERNNVDKDPMALVRKSEARELLTAAIPKLQNETGVEADVPPGALERRPTIEFLKKVEAIFTDGIVVKAADTRQRIIRPKLQFYNTFQLEPIAKFSRKQVENCIEETLETSLMSKKYSSNAASALSGNLAEVIRNRVLEFGYDRYKIVVVVNVGPKARQGVEIGTQCLWDSSRDHYAAGTYESYHLFASACVYGIYYD